jgi:hypothetical protein
MAYLIIFYHYILPSTTLNSKLTDSQNGKLSWSSLLFKSFGKIHQICLFYNKHKIKTKKYLDYLN